MGLIQSLFFNGSIGVRINDTNSDFSESSRGARQEDPASLMLIDFVAILFTRMLTKAGVMARF
jgi:hypothetical protein